MTEEQSNTPTGEENQADTPTNQDGVVFDGEAQDPTEQTDQKKEAIPQEVQDKINKKYNRLHFEREEMRREKEALAKRNQELEAKLNKPPDKDLAPPDPYAEDYQDQLNRYQEALKQNYIRQGEEQLRAKMTQEQNRATVQEKVKTMYKKADKYGISSYDLKDAENKVSGILQNPDIAMYILEHNESPLIVKHLANSVEDLFKVKDMPTAQAAVYIDNVIKQNAQALKPKASNAPKPLEIPEGRGAGKKENPFLVGVEWE